MRNIISVVFVDMQKISFTRQFVVEKKPQSGWGYYVGQFTDRLNAVADGFLKDGKTHYPSGQKIVLFSNARVGMDLGRYCKAMGCKTLQNRISALSELYDLCDKSDMGFTKKYWWTCGYGKKK